MVASIVATTYYYGIPLEIPTIMVAAAVSTVTDIMLVSCTVIFTLACLVTGDPGREL